MRSTSVSGELIAGLSSYPGERRKNHRFGMRFPVLLRCLGEPWTSTETGDVSAMGAFFVTDRPFLLNAPIEYVLTFPAELTKAPQHLRVRFFGTVIRCERVPDGSGHYGVAVRNSAHRYLTREEAAGFDAIESKPPQSVASRNNQQASGTGR
jgi:hypothetical protein